MTKIVSTTLFRCIKKIKKGLLWVRWFFYFESLLDKMLKRRKKLRKYAKIGIYGIKIINSHIVEDKKQFLSLKFISI